MKFFAPPALAIAAVPLLVSAFPLERRAFNSTGKIPSTFNAKTNPNYTVSSPFDYASIQLGIMQEYIELDLFNYGLTRFSAEEFEAQGITADYRELIRFMAQQEIGHAEVLSNIIGATAVKPCKYRYNFNTVGEFVDFCQRLTRWGESGVYGFLGQLENRAASQILLQSITTEARQQMAFRQFSGLFPMPVWFETGITQSMTWTQLAPYIVECPSDNYKIVWNNFPALNITNNPNPLEGNYTAAISTNRTALSYGGREVAFSWEAPGKTVGPKGFNYTTGVGGNTTTPKYAAFIAQYNVTYSPLYNVSGNTGYAKQPNVSTFPTDPAFNGSMFIALTDSNPFVTPYNITAVDQHIVAGPTVYVAG